MNESPEYPDQQPRLENVSPRAHQPFASLSKEWLRVLGCLV